MSDQIRKPEPNLVEQTPQSKKPKKEPKVSIAAPRFWHGMRFLTYMRLLKDGGFRIHFLGIGMCFAIFCYSCVNSILALIQWLIWGRKIANAKFEQAPVFIIGHWRSGTTLVHELLNFDDNLAAPSTYECFAANHFLVSELLLKPIVAMAMPKQRPMDNMPSGVDRPQEDEFAICTIGSPSPYLSLAFPNQPRLHRELIDMKDVDADDLQVFTNSLKYFYQVLTVKHKKRLLLKSPTHTGRIEFLRKQFPGAKFIHVTRDPMDVVPSTIRLWKRLDAVNGFQIPNYDDDYIRQFVLETYRQMYRAFIEQTKSDSSDIATISYSDLISNPVAQLKDAYGKLGLNDFDSVEPKVRDYFENQKDYQKNQHQLGADLVKQIDEYCGEFSEQFAAK